MSGWDDSTAPTAEDSSGGTPQEEVFIGRDVGQRVQVRAGLRQEGQGTIDAVDASGLHCTVRWDSQKVDRRLITGDDGRGYLVAAPAARTQAPATPTYSPNNLASRASPPNSGYQTMPKSPTFVGSPPRSINQSVNASNTAANASAYTPPPASKLLENANRMSLPANITNARTTVGLTLYGTKVDYTVPGGPAHLCQQLDKDDEVIAVNGVPITHDDVSEHVIGQDQPGTVVELSVKKANGVVQTVSLPRILRSTMENMVRLFQYLTMLKQNGHNNADYEAETLPQESLDTLTLVDHVVSLIAQQQLQIHSEKELSQRSSFAGSQSETMLKNEILQLRAMLKKVEIEKEELGEYLKEVQVTASENEAAYDQQVRGLLGEKFQMEQRIQGLEHELEEERTKSQQQAIANNDIKLHYRDEIHILQSQNITVQQQLVLLQQELLAKSREPVREPVREPSPDPPSIPSRVVTPPPPVEIRGVCSECGMPVTVEDARVKMETGLYVHAECYRMMDSKRDTLIGIKIQDQPPHLVQMVVDLIDENGVNINDKVQVGDKLWSLDDVHVSALGVGQLARIATGPEGSLVKLTFVRKNTDADGSDGELYTVSVQRHLSLATGEKMNELAHQIRSLKPQVREALASASNGARTTLPTGEVEVRYQPRAEFEEQLERTINQESLPSKRTSKASENGSDRAPKDSPKPPPAPEGQKEADKDLGDLPEPSR